MSHAASHPVCSPVYVYIFLGRAKRQEGLLTGRTIAGSSSEHKYEGYTYDAFWSHDGWDECETGYSFQKGVYLKIQDLKVPTIDRNTFKKHVNPVQANQHQFVHS